MSDIEPYVPDQMDGADDFGAFNDPRYGSVSSASTPSIHYVNESGLPQDVWERHRGRIDQEVASVIEKWSQSLSGASNQTTLDVFNRNKWDNAKHPFAIMSQCAWAVENDDILSTTCDVVEGLTWQKCRFDLFDADQEDVWNQWAADVDLDTRLRQIGRELFKISQVYVGMWWEKRTYGVRDDDIDDSIDKFEAVERKRKYEKDVRDREEYLAVNPGVELPEIPKPADIGPGKGNHKRKKQFSVRVPTSFTIFDPTKVIPIGQLMFGKERFAYVATREENEAFTKVFSGDIADSTILQLLERKIDPSASDRAACAEVGVDHSNLWLFREDAIFRHTLTRAEYERFAPVRLKSVLPILEMKQHLRAADRAALIGQTNFIVVITKGTDKLPAKAAEIENLQAQAKVIARLPVLVGDHRLNVEIVSPDMTNVLQDSRWQALDQRLVFKALQSYSPVTQGGNSSGTGVSEMSRVIAKGMESRRHMIVRTLQAKVFQKILDKNPDELDEMPTLEFSPKRITLDMKAEVIQQILKLRDRGDLSRETVLEEMDYDQDIEVLRRAQEKAIYDRVFQSGVPHSSPGMNPFATQQGPGAPPPPGTPPPPGGQAPGQPVDPQKPGANVGPKGQPRTEGGRPPGATDKQPRKPAK